MTEVGAIEGNALDSMTTNSFNLFPIHQEYMNVGKCQKEFITIGG